MRNTNRKDCNDKEIYVGDYVVHWSGACKWENERKEIFKVSEIVIIEKENNDVYSLGGLYNSWKSEDIRKISKEEFNKMNIPLRCDYFKLKNGKYVQFTDQHFLGLNNKEWEQNLIEFDMGLLKPIKLGLK